MIDKKQQLIGYWTSSNLELCLEPRATLKLLWPVDQQVARGAWHIDGNQLHFSYNTNSAHSIKFEFGLRKSRHEHSSVYELEIISKDRIALTDESLQRIQLVLNPEKTYAILQKAQAEENVFQAIVLTIFVCILIGGLVRWIITPEIPTWLIVIAIFIGSYFFMKRSN